MQTMMQTVHRLHLSDQRQDHHCVVNARSNRNRSEESLAAQAQMDNNRKYHVLSNYL